MMEALVQGWLQPQQPWPKADPQLPVVGQGMPPGVATIKVLHSRV